MSFKMRRKKKQEVRILVTSVILVCLSIGTIQAQENSDYKSEYLPATPTAASIQKYVDVPVNLATGTPDISIPLYEIVVGDFKLPVTLNYHAAGFRVQESASWVGLGWSLSVPGTVSRAIRGKEDDGSYSPFFKDFQGAMLDKENADDYRKLVRLEKGLVDSYPDLYSYNFAGHSGRFIVPNNQKILMMPVEPLKINASITGVGSIRADDGTAFYFNKIEESFTRSSSTAQTAMTSQYLTQIVTPKGREINFAYKPTNFQQSVNKSCTKKYVSKAGGGYQDLSESRESFITKVNGQCLTEITFPGGTIRFNSSADDRLDVVKDQGAVGDYKLNSIEVLDSDGNSIKKIFFQYDYFNRTSTDVYARRLKLNSIEIGNGNEYPQTYSFTYEERYGMPSRIAFSGDHWGYNNGQNVEVPPLNLATGVVNMSGKNTDKNAVKAYVLTQITYPTGGYTRYEYEANDHYSPGEFMQYERRYGYVQAPRVVPCPKPSEDPCDDEQDGEGPFDIKPGSRNIIFRVGISRPANSNKNEIIFAYLRSQSAKFESTHYNTPQDVPMSSLPPADDYYIIARCEQNGGTGTGTLEWEVPVTTLINNPVIGGVRIRKITQYDGQDHSRDIIRKYAYRLASDTTHSSGELQVQPSYQSNFAGFTCTSNNCIEKNQIWVSSRPTMLGTGSHVVYSEVTVYYGAKGEKGKTRYTFTTSPNPSKENSDTNWRRGKVLTQTDWDADGHVVKHLINTYKVTPGSFQRAYGLGVKSEGMHPQANTDEMSGFPRYFGQSPAVMESEFQYQASKEEFVYNPKNQQEFVRQFEEFQYESPNHYQLTAQSRLNGVPNEKIYTRYLYAADYSDGTPFIDDMKTAFFSKLPIETVTYKTGTQGTVILSGELSIYKPGTRPLPAERWQFESSPLARLPQFRFSNQSLAGVIPTGEVGDAVFQRDGGYKIKRTYDVYDGNNNPVQYTEYTVPFALRWGVSGTVVSSLTQFAKSENIFYTSFEEDGVQDLDAKAGNKSRNTPYDFVPSSDFKVVPTMEMSYWYFNGTQWVLKKQPYTGGNVRIADGTKIDELRIYPKNAQMSTYVYKPLVGVGWILDPNQQVTYYDYNDLGQLIRIRNQEGYIVKAFSYHYNSQ